MLKTPRVFLVDDDFDDQMIFKEALQEVDKNIECITACDCEEALLKLYQPGQLPDYIFLDLNMPKMNGFECLKEIKQRPSMNHVPVIIRSTSSTREDMEKSKRLGAADYVIKSLSYADLTCYLRNLFLS